VYLNIAIAIVHMEDAHAWHPMTRRERDEKLCVLEEGGRGIPKEKGVIPPKIKNNFYLKTFFFFFFFIHFHSGLRCGG
jgi:hypothetical protein